jgi:excisionase family DNA binding protein
VTVPKKFVDQKLLSTGEVAKLMNVHRGTVWNWIRVGLLKAEKVTDRYSGVSRKAFAEFKKAYRQAPPTVSPTKDGSSEKATRRRFK